MPPVKLTLWVHGSQLALCCRHLLRHQLQHLLHTRLLLLLLLPARPVFALLFAAAAPACIPGRGLRSPQRGGSVRGRGQHLGRAQQVLGWVRAKGLQRIRVALRRGAKHAGEPPAVCVCVCVSAAQQQRLGACRRSAQKLEV
jgi:hypothetical protein